MKFLNKIKNCAKKTKVQEKKSETDMRGRIGVRQIESEKCREGD